MSNVSVLRVTGVVSRPLVMGDPEKDDKIYCCAQDNQQHKLSLEVNLRTPDGNDQLAIAGSLSLLSLTEVPNALHELQEAWTNRHELAAGVTQWASFPYWKQQVFDGEHFVFENEIFEDSGNGLRS